MIKPLKSIPNYAKAYFNRGTAKKALGQHKATIEDFDQTLRLTPDNTKAYFNRGTTKLRMGRIGDAIADFDRWVRGSGGKEAHATA